LIYLNTGVNDMNVGTLRYDKEPEPPDCEHRRSLSDDGDWYACDLTRDKPCDEEMHRTCQTRRVEE